MAKIKKKPEKLHFSTHASVQRYIKEKKFKLVEVVSVKGKMLFNVVTPAGRPRTLKLVVTNDS